MAEEMLSNEELRLLMKKGYVFKKSTEKKIYSNYYLFLRSLYKNYEMTMNSLSEYDYSDVDFEEMDENISLAILSVFDSKEFYVTKKNFSALGYNPLILLSSLKYDYDNVLQMIIENNKKGRYVVIPSLDNEDIMIEDFLEENHFVLNSRNFSLIKNSSTFLIASLKNNYAETEGALDCLSDEDNFIVLSKRQFKEMVDVVFNEEYINFSDLPKILKNIIAHYISQNYIYGGKDKELIDNLVDRGLIPLTYFDFDSLASSYDLIEKHCKSESAATFLYNKISYYNSKNYNEYDERMLIEFLGDEYSHCSCVEDIIKELYYKGKTRDNMNLFEMFSLNLYAAKTLKKNNIDMYVDVFNYSTKITEYGSCDNKRCLLNISANNINVFKMVQTLNHELEHAIQFECVKKGDIIKDYDIDLYSKDSIMKEILGKDYYKKHYNKISFEYDAELKASLRTIKLFDLVDLDFDHNNDVSIMKSNARKSIAQAERYVYSNGYEQNNSRNLFYSLDEWFETEMDILRISDNKKYNELLDSYPIIKYDYNWKNNCIFKRKTILELVDDLDKASLKREKGIYFNLLKCRIDPYKSVDVRENIEELISLLESGKYDGITEKIIENLIESSKDYKNNKYQGYFYRNGGNKR